MFAMKYLVLVLIVALLGIGTFGFLGVGHEAGSHETCALASTMTIPCPVEAFASAMFHIAALAGLGTVPLSLALTLVLLLALALFAGLGDILRLRPAPSLHTWRIENSNPAPTRALLRALARYEHSPTFS